jgi:hypothetical protein
LNVVNLEIVFEGLDLWGQGTAIYVIVAIILVVLVLGSILCCGCTLLYYYYYRSHQQASEQYWNNAGWQPMTDDEQVVDPNAEEKQAEAEAEQYQYEHEYPTGNSSEYIPPPYALYNGAYVSTEQEKEQKYI